MQPQNQSVFIGIIAILLVLGGMHWASERNNSDMQQLASEQTEAQQQSEGSSAPNDNGTAMDMNSGAEMNMESHSAMLDDGLTVMFMAGTISPAVLYAAPGQEVRILNHESQDLQLVLENGVESEIVASGSEGSFTAPTEPGAYVYHSSKSDTVSGTLVVETQ